MKTRVITDVFSPEEIQELLNYFAHTPVSTVEANGNRNKNLDYHLPGSIVQKIVKPKLDKALGPDHEFSSGAYKECIMPYGTHIDGTEAMSQRGVSVFNTPQKYNAAVLIPMLEDEHFTTVSFNYFSETIPGMSMPLPETALGTEPNNLNLEDFDHIPEPALSQLRYLPVDTMFKWKLGSMLMWDRAQLHTSTNFAKFGKVKKFIIIFVA